VTKAKSVEQVKQALFAVDGKPVDDAYARMVFERLSMPGAGHAFLSALVGSAGASRLNSRLHKIGAATLLLWGKEDAMIPIKFIDPFVKMKNCRIIMLEGCGHRPHVEKPALFNRIITDFMR
jgi:pimeloyl-ACP methyl ester carboxylesterase